MEPKLKFEPLGNGVNIAVSKHHTFGTDAVLLSNFANAKANDRVIDLGTGCGIIAFLMLRDKKKLNVTGVDISSEAIDLCNITNKENGFLNANFICSDLKDLKGKVEFGCNTLITCNPPYKKMGTGIKNPDKVDSVARHEVACTVTDIINVSSKLLQTGGRLCICQRPERLAEIMELMRRAKIEPKRLRLVSQRIGEEPWLFLLEGKKCANTGLRIAPTLYIEKNGELSDEMKEIYGAYKEAYL